MNLPEKAIAVLFAAERQLVDLAHEAGNARDYDGATALLEAARRVKLVGDNSAGAHELAEHRTSGETPAPTPSSAPKRVRKSDFPKFFRDGDVLIKVGWSKAEKSEYEHKSPKKVVDALALALIEAGAKGRRFTMDKVIPLKDAADASPLPDYQVYLCLAWLRHDGLVVQHGRQGYSLPKNGDLPSAIERIWSLLPSRS